MRGCAWLCVAVECGCTRCLRPPCCAPAAAPAPAGERYEGEWADGTENGMGTFVAADGSTYYGSWLAGAMHGKCVFRPAAGDAGAG